MSSQTPTLKDLFATGHAEHRDPRSLPAPPAALAPILGRFQWQGVCDKAFDLLDISIVDVMLGGWKKHADFRKHVRASAADPTTAVLVHLGAHRVASEHNPSITVRCDGRVLAELTFPIEVTFEVEAVELTLRGGVVTEIRTGAITGRGTVKFENTVILERELGPIHLPGRIALTGDRHGASPRTMPPPVELTRPPGEYVLLK